MRRADAWFTADRNGGKLHRGASLFVMTMAEEEGFEPPWGKPQTVFKTAALDHSAIPPVENYSPPAAYHQSAPHLQ